MSKWHQHERRVLSGVGILAGGMGPLPNPKAGKVCLCMVKYKDKGGSSKKLHHQNHE